MLNLQGSVLVIGDVMLDVYIIGNATRLSPEAPIPIVSVQQRTQTLGGAGNVVLNLSGLGCKVHLLGVRGDDIAGDEVINILQRNHVDYALYINKLFPTTTKTRVIANRQQLIRFDDERLNGNSSSYQYLKSAASEIISTVKAVVLSDYGKGVLSYDLIQHIVKLANNFGIPVLVDPKQHDWNYYRGATIITPNTSELAASAQVRYESDGDWVLDCAISQMQEYNFKSLIVTRGDKGLLVVGDDHYEFIPTKAKSVFDVSGAGDTVIATIAACLCSGYSIFESARIANTAAGIVVGKLGTSPITLDELNQEIVNE